VIIDNAVQMESRQHFRDGATNLGLYVFDDPAWDPDQPLPRPQSASDGYMPPGHAQQLPPWDADAAIGPDTIADIPPDTDDHCAPDAQNRASQPGAVNAHPCPTADLSSKRTGDLTGDELTRLLKDTFQPIHSRLEHLECLAMAPPPDPPTQPATRPPAPPLLAQAAAAGQNQWPELNQCPRRSGRGRNGGMLNTPHATSYASAATQPAPPPPQTQTMAVTTTPVTATAMPHEPKYTEVTVQRDGGYLDATTERSL
jgi:hypothetical protein